MNTIIFDTFETRPDHFPFYLVTWRSLLPHLRDERVILNNFNAAPELIAQVPDRFEIRNDTTCYPSLWLGFSVHLRRWRNADGDPRDKVLFADCRDCLFQRNPFDDVATDGLIVSGEGSIMKDDPWNTGDQLNVGKSIPEEVRPKLKEIEQWLPVCAGVYAGQRQRVRDFALMIWLVSSPLRQGTDQGAMNYIFNHYLAHETGAALCNPHTNDWCMGGHHFRNLQPPCEWRDGLLICGATQRPYAIVHQWDRTAWRQDILDRWG